jgi:hypothetical protein
VAGHHHRMTGRVEAASARSDDLGSDNGGKSASHVYHARARKVDHTSEEGVWVHDGHPARG